MTLRGTAFLPIWHDVEASMEDEFNHWHTAEHMPERVDTPGITVGRRYADLSADKYRYFTLYEAESFDVFSSDGYFATANARSTWTQRVHPAFENFKRAPCHLLMTRGRGIAGGLLTARIHFPATAHDKAPAHYTAKDVFSVAARATLESILKMQHVTAVHLGIVGQVKRLPLSQASLSVRPEAANFDAVYMVEAISSVALRKIQADISRLFETDAIARHEIGIYDLAYHLSDISGR